MGNVRSTPRRKLGPCHIRVISSQYCYSVLVWAVIYWSASVLIDRALGVDNALFLARNVALSALVAHSLIHQCHDRAPYDWNSANFITRPASCWSVVALSPCTRGLARKSRIGGILQREETGRDCGNHSRPERGTPRPVAVIRCSVIGETIGAQTNRPPMSHTKSIRKDPNRLPENCQQPKENESLSGGN